MVFGAIGLLWAAGSTLQTPAEEQSVVGAESFSLHSDLESSTMNEIGLRCLSTFTRRCNEKKLEKYATIVRELSRYFALHSTPEKPLDINAKYMLISTLVKRSFHELGFVGFYSVERHEGRERLEIAPYASNITATPIIEIGRGVCGESWQRAETMIVADVTQHPNYIACDEVTMSEIVVPYFGRDGRVKAVFDIDADVKSFFEETDKICLEEALKMLSFY